MRKNSSISKSEVSVPIDLETKSVKKLVVEPLATVGQGLCAAAVHDSSYDSLFTAPEMGVSKLWVFRPVKESGRKVLSERF